jgi:hypothetical protein
MKLLVCSKKKEALRASIVVFLNVCVYGGSRGVGKGRYIKGLEKG